MASGVFLGAHENDAIACGACYANQSESTIVNDHRMALSISPNVTVLWDQIAYSGNPTEFAPSKDTRGSWAVIILAMLALRGIVRRSRKLGG